MAGNARQFAADLHKEAIAFTEKNFRLFRNKLLFDGAAIIDEAWPVDTGFSRASNLPFADDPDSGISVAGPDAADFAPDEETGTSSEVDWGDPMTDEKTDAIRAILRTTDPFDTVGIATNVAYAPALEDGHSEQGSDMYRNSANAIQDVVESVK